MSRLDFGTRLSLATTLALFGSLALFGAGCAVESNEPPSAADDDGDPAANEEIADALDANGNLRLRAASVTKTKSCLALDTARSGEVKLAPCDGDARYQLLKPIGRKLDSIVAFQLRFATPVNGKTFCLTAAGAQADGTLGVKAGACLPASTKPTPQNFLLRLEGDTTRVCLGSAPSTCLRPTAAQNDVALAKVPVGGQSSPMWNWTVLAKAKPPVCRPTAIVVSVPAPAPDLKPGAGSSFTFCPPREKIGHFADCHPAAAGLPGTCAYSCGSICE